MRVLLVLLMLCCASGSVDPCPSSDLLRCIVEEELARCNSSSRACEVMPLPPLDTTVTPVRDAASRRLERATLTLGGLAFALLFLLIVGTIVYEAGRTAAETPLKEMR
jgi:hypothetical protein